MMMYVQRASSDPLLKGIHAGSMNDVIHRNWLSKLHEYSRSPIFRARTVSLIIVAHTYRARDNVR